MQLFVCAQEVYTFKGPSQENPQIKAHVALPEGIASEDPVVLLAGTPLEDEYLATCLEVKFPGPCWESKRSDSEGGQIGEKEEEDRPRQAVYAVQPALCQCCVDPWQEEGPQCQLLSPL
ncbi:hypothetical protein HPG69_017105 [Diceros bicornis minor]|uniref:Uncharacterized protein n=1 Tax=Diceros bicornis minor TaxID=77932 RepID=A0A7J7ECS1_DICBM|nr:hypothetical protein HPG69_017105 [Diceros bicornis minor]